MSGPTTSYKLLTVNTAPERAKKLVGRVIEILKGKYDIIHVDNCDNMDQVLPKATKHQPDLLISASTWTAAEALVIHERAQSVVAGLRTHAIPTGLQVEKGPDAIVEYLVENIAFILG